MSLRTARARFERRQRDLFFDTATVTRPGEGGLLDPATGAWTPAATTTVYSGACKIRGVTWEGTDVQHGDVESRRRPLTAGFPKDTPIRMDDIVVPTASTFDPGMVGKSYRVTDVPDDGWQIRRWCMIEEIIAGVT